MASSPLCVVATFSPMLHCDCSLKLFVSYFELLLAKHVSLYIQASHRSNHSSPSRHYGVHQHFDSASVSDSWPCCYPSIAQILFSLTRDNSTATIFSNGTILAAAFFLSLGIITPYCSLLIVMHQSDPLASW